MQRKQFIRQTALTAAAFVMRPISNFAFTSFNFPIVRVPESQRKFKSEAVENMIKKFNRKVPDKELGWLFENTFPNTLDTTVDFEIIDGKPDTYIITGDIDAMWLRDSTAQVWPYLPLTRKDKHLQDMIAGVINRQFKYILKDPYANAFYKDENKRGEWKDDKTDMQPGIHERKWEIDSLCYPVRLSYHYWKTTGDTTPFTDKWKEAALLIRKTFIEQQRKNGDGPYKFERTTSWATDGVPLGGYGYPVKPVGLICSMFRPSDDATIFPFLIPANFFAVVSLQQLAEIFNAVYKDADTAKEMNALANEVKTALNKYAIIKHEKFGEIYAYEVNGFGSYNIMDDANVPSLLSLPYLGAVAQTDKIYQNTRKLLLSSDNPFFWKGTAGEGIGGPHAGMHMIWPLSIIMRGLTSNNDKEIKQCIETLKTTHGDTGFMHESFHKDDPKKFTRKWFAWANTIFGEFMVKVATEKPHLLG